jgi:hypothetical protein
VDGKLATLELGTGQVVRHQGQPARRWLGRMRRSREGD